MRSFTRGLILTILLVTSASTLLALAMPTLRSHADFLIATMASMIVFCVVLFRLAVAAAGRKRGQDFIGVVMAGVFLKMFLCLGLILGYKKLGTPVDNTFLWPFLVIYVGFTIFEVIFMDRLGRQKPSST